jgi:hypothetical protein
MSSGISLEMMVVGPDSGTVTCLTVESSTMLLAKGVADYYFHLAQYMALLFNRTLLLKVGVG